MRSLALLPLTATLTHAFWRMSCPGRLVVERIDPIVTPGSISSHVHTVSGGSGFGFTSSYEQQRASTCSSCPIKQDLSAYWTPKLYYMGSNGTFEDVPQSGGMTVYYQQRTGKKPGSSDSDVLKAFPPGLRMVAGNPFQRNATGLDAAPGKAVSFVCLDYNGGSSSSLNIPNKNCPDGLRAQIYFPSCWDGKNNDTADHRSHMAYPIGHYDNGYCPDTHPVHLISIFFEVTYSIDTFSSRWYNSDGSHPFVFAQGDRTGYGFHGDFLNGWDTRTLQTAVDTCNNNSGKVEDCPVFVGNLFTSDQCKACMIPPSVNEQTTGLLKALPGCNTPTTGPALASPPPKDCVANRVSMDAPKTFYTDFTKSGWAYQGCGRDNVVLRTFPGATRAAANMTIDSCLAFCKSKGYRLAGLEYGSQCFCDNDYRNNNSSDSPRQPQKGILGACGMPCGGNATQVCGGPSALSVYRDCRGGVCQNVNFTQF